MLPPQSEFPTPQEKQYSELTKKYEAHALPLMRDKEKETEEDKERKRERRKEETNKKKKLREEKERKENI